MAAEALRVCCSSGCSGSGLRGQPLRNISTAPSSSRTAVEFRRGCEKRSGRKQQSLIRCCGIGEAGDPGKQLRNVLWGKGLPPGALVDVARQLWGSGWQVMMGQLAPSKKEGDYDRPQSQFRARPRVPGNFHLYLATTCPWAHRALIVHSLKGLGDAVPVSIVVPGSSGLWEFSPAASDSGTFFVFHHF